MAFNIAIDRDDDANYAGTRTRPTPPQPPERSETARNSSRNDTPHDIDGVVIEGDHELRAPHDHQSRHKVMTTGVEHRRQAQSRQTAASQSICEDGTGGVGSRNAHGNIRRTEDLPRQGDRNGTPVAGYCHRDRLEVSPLGVAMLGAAPNQPAHGNDKGQLLKIVERLDRLN
jgi:hypothetical protein